MVEHDLAVLVVEIGERAYAIPIVDVVEVAAMVELLPLPQPSASVMGLFNRQGAILPMIDARRVLGLTPCVLRPDTLFVFVQHVPYRAGLVVDAILGVQYLSTHALHPVPVSQTWLQHSAAVGDTMLPVLALATFLHDLLPEFDNETVS